LSQELKFIITTSAIFFVHKVASLRDSPRCLSLPSTDVLGYRDAAASRLHRGWSCPRCAVFRGPKGPRFQKDKQITQGRL